MNILDLPLKDKWYNMIESGIKKEEYREMKPYWYKRLCIPSPNEKLTFKHIESVRFRYGYTKKTMLFKLDNITTGYGNTDWGAPKDEKVFIIKLGERITIK